MSVYLLLTRFKTSRRQKRKHNDVINDVIHLWPLQTKQTVRQFQKERRELLQDFPAILFVS